MARGIARRALCALAMGMVCARAEAESQAENARSPMETFHSGVAIAPRDILHPKPVVVYLHGICGAAKNGCLSFAESTRDYGWLVCPNANVHCDSGGFAWSGTAQEKQRVIDRAIDEVAERYAVDRSFPPVLIGFSQGGYAARELIAAYPTKYRAALFIGADVKVDPTFTRNTRLTRFAFAAGKYDMTARAMRATAESLSKQGISAQFLSLGDVGHTYVPERPDIGLTALIDWILTD